MASLRLPPAIRSALDETGLPWAIESGTRHFHVRIDGKLVAILPQGTTRDRNQRAEKNTISQIKRFARTRALSTLTQET